MHTHFSVNPHGTVVTQNLTWLLILQTKCVSSARFSQQTETVRLITANLLVFVMDLRCVFYDAERFDEFQARGDERLLNKYDSKTRYTSRTPPPPPTVVWPRRRPVRIITHYTTSSNSLLFTPSIQQASWIQFTSLNTISLKYCHRSFVLVLIQAPWQVDAWWCGGISPRTLDFGNTWR
jgi:hypothetical protein